MFPESAISVLELVPLLLQKELWEMLHSDQERFSSLGSGPASDKNCRSAHEQLFFIEFGGKKIIKNEK